MKHQRHDADDRFKKRRRKRNPALLLILATGLLICLLSGGGVGIGAYFYFRGKGPTAESAPDGDKRVDLRERFQGSWQGVSPGRPTLKLRLDVRPDQFTFAARNTITNKEGIFTHNWKLIKSADKSMLIRQGKTGADKTYEWEIIFKSADEMSIRSVTDDNILGEYTRVSKK